MSEPSRPVFFYLFPKGNDYEIIRMTDSEATRYWKQNRRWVDVPQKTLEDAQELRRLYLAEKRK